MEINPSVSGPHDPVPPRPQKHSNTDDSALPAARRHPPAPELRGLEQKGDADGTQRRRRTLFRSRARETPSPESPNQGPGVQKKDIVRAVDDAVGQVQPHPVEALTASLTQAVCTFKLLHFRASGASARAYL